MRVWLPIPGQRPPSFKLRIALRGLSPPVCRRVLVPEYLTLTQLHNVIQVVTGRRTSAHVQHSWHALWRSSGGHLAVLHSGKRTAADRVSSQRTRRLRLRA
ncbi:hypothetical protein C2U69_31795 [Cupriavidus pinatubonensis]|nr:hypothetical protein C2U69_31795 [Cupriavidus pinatubonensis]